MSVWANDARVHAGELERGSARAFSVACGCGWRDGGYATQKLADEAYKRHQWICGLPGADKGVGNRRGFLRWLVDVKGVERMTVRGLAAHCNRRLDDTRSLLSAEGIPVERDHYTGNETVSLTDLLRRWPDA